MTSWVPSHVEITIHQARDLLLKTKNSSSLVYVSVNADREKCQSQHLPPSTAPLWQFTSRIPLMSLGTTLLICVRQKTSFKDKFLGLVSIPLATFTISSKPITHWYKLGAKAGKTSSKLRGELLLSIRFLSNWVAEETEVVDFSFGSSLARGETENKKNRKLRSSKSVKFSSSPLGIRRKSMLKRTKSEAKPRSSDAGAESTTRGRETEGKGERAGKKDKSIFRLSIKKKTRSPVLEECSDEFMSLSLPVTTESPLADLSPPSQLQSLLQGGEGDVFGGKTTEYLSRSLDRSKHLPNGHGAGVVGGGGGGERGREEENRENQPPGEKMSPALRYHNFRRKKRPWSMHNIPPTTPQSDSSEEPSPSTQLPQGGGSEESQSGEVVTFRAKSSLVRGVANGGRRPVRSNSTVTDSNLELLNLTTPTRSPVPAWGGRGLGDQVCDRSSGLGNVALSSTLPASIRQRSQSVGGASGTPPTPRRGARSTKGGSGDSNIGSSSSSSSQLAKMKSMGLGPRVPLATSLGDSPHKRPGGRASPVHLVSEDHSPRSSPLAPRTSSGGGNPAIIHPRNPSPIHLQSTLVEEEEEEEEEEGLKSPTRQQERRQHVEITVKSRVPIETESSAFQVDASELEVVLEATTPRRRSIVALPQSPVRQSPSSVPGSPMDSPVGKRKLPITPGSTPESNGARNSLLPATHSLQKLPNSLTPATLQTRAHSTSPIAVTNRGGGGGGEEVLSGRSSSAMVLSAGEGGERGDVVDGAATLPRGSTTGSRHTVSEKLPTQDYEPLPALPPCLIQSPQHTQLTRRQSEPHGVHSTPPRRQISLQPGPKSSSSQGLPFVPKHVQGLYNIRTFDLRIFELQQQQQQQQQQRHQSQPGVSVTNPSFDESDSTTTTNGNRQQPPPAPSSTHTRSVTPENPHSPTKTSAATSSSSHKLSQTYPGSPISSSGQERGDGVAGGGGGVRRGGGLQAVVIRYQENRRRSGKGSPSRRTSGDFGNVRLNSAEFGSPSSSSAGSSPILTQRKASTHVGHAPRGSPESGSWRNPFSNLRRTQSHKTPPTKRDHRQQLEIVNSSRLQGPAHSSVESLGVSSTASSPGHDASDTHLELEGGTTASRNTNSNNEQCGSQISATPTSLPSDTDSLRTFGSERTLVDGSGSGTDVPDGGGGGASRQTRHQNLFLSLPPGSRHKQTCSSVDSEGLGSLASEEIEEAGPSDWAQWSKEELVRELVQTKNRLRSTDEELKAVRGYLDNLLLRIMESSPGILSVETP